MVKRRKQLSTPHDVIAALGGLSSLGRLARRRPSQVFEWRKRGWFPARFYPAMRKELRKRGYDAPRDLWDFEPEQSSAAA